MFEVTASGCEYFGSPDAGDAMGTLAAGDVYRARAASATEQGGCTWLQFEKDGRTCCVALRKDRVRLYTRAATADSAAGGALDLAAGSAATSSASRGAEGGGSAGGDSAGGGSTGGGSTGGDSTGGDSADVSVQESVFPGLVVTGKDGQRTSYTSIRGNNILSLRVGRFTASFRISLSTLRQLRAEGIDTITFQTILCSTTLSVDELLAMGGEDTPVALAHSMGTARLTVGGEDHSELLK